ncbi:CLK4-associating serine/arginine rich protein [Mytilus edulis]|uniref:CLK4-associating serine/arginine rich protein n=1 Tax=Mytilus edulis TaxID=6550 RepID=A0A8S3Q1B5_MYTED|nr:CLK4-associating serine/arginine rich protein [Mytilus edulis]
MWQEARKQEKKIRGLMVDYKKRAERRREFYEKIKLDPAQFVRAYGRPCKINLDPAVAYAAESPQSMMPWQGQEDNMIDRFDVRAHLDYMPQTKIVAPPTLSKREEEERSINYERYRIIVENECAGLILLILMNSYIQPVRFIFVHQSINSTCLLPDIDPFDKSVMQYIWHPKPIVCEPSASIVYIDKMGKLQLNRSEISNKNNHFDCFYRLIKRSGDNDVTLSQEVKFLRPVYIPSDYVNVKCFADQRLLYDIVLHNVDFKTVQENKEILNENDKCLSVLIFGLDSVSRLAAERKLPKTMNLIKSSMDINFKGYTSIAAITYPNLMASLTGKTAYSNELPKLNPRKEFTDKYPFIWKNFSQKGYVTMFSEDFPEISMFNYMQKGFKDSPVDHYLRPYYIAREKLHPVQSNLDQVFMFLEDKDIKMKKYSSLCYKSRPKHAIHIDHYKNFVSTYKGYRKFGLSWLTEIGHDYMNFLEHADDDIEQMIQYFYNEGLFKNTIFILFGDHGPRTDEIRNTAIGRIEERMPLLSIIIPEQIKNKYPHIHTNLQDNENKLTSPFDLHETFVDILNENFTLSEKVMTRPYPRG